jgi:hypothetical protein
LRALFIDNAEKNRADREKIIRIRQSAMLIWLIVFRIPAGPIIRIRIAIKIKLIAADIIKVLFNK